MKQTEIWTWGSANNISWTQRWGYVIIGINVSDFSPSGGNGTLDTINTGTTTDGQTVKGVTEFKFAQNANLYIDRVIICDAQSDVSVDAEKMFPSLISGSTVTVNLDNMVPTFSVGITGSSNTPDDTDSHIYLVTAAAQTASLGTSTYSSSADTSLYLTPTSALSAGTNYILFVRPVDTPGGNVGTCQVYNFSLILDDDGVLSTSFQRELTN